MSDLVLVTGATGFVGQRLIARLATGEHRIRAMARDASRFSPPDGVADGRVEVVEADLGDAASLGRPFDGVDAAFYLVHAMGSGEDVYEADRTAATHYRDAALRAGVVRTVYMGAVGEGPDGVSEHLRSRGEVERVLGEALPGFVAVRAAMAVGARSGSFRALAQIVDHLPVLALPPWRANRSNPIDVEDVAGCLVAALDAPPGRYDVGGPDELSFEELCDVVGELLGRRRPKVPLPIGAPSIEGLASSLLADTDRQTMTALLEGLRDDLRVTDNACEPVFGVTPTPFRDAARRAIEEIRAEA